jgi:hypothetical protein
MIRGRRDLRGWDDPQIPGYAKGAVGDDPISPYDWESAATVAAEMRCVAIENAVERAGFRLSPAPAENRV